MSSVFDSALDALIQSKSSKRGLKYSKASSSPTRVEREAPEQKALVDWANITTIAGYRIGEYLTHVPNEGKRGPLAQKQFKELGGKAGYPDLILDIPTEKYNGLRIEMKPPRQYRSKLSPVQKEWQERLNKVGYLAVVCYGFEEGIRAIEKYLLTVLTDI